MEISVNGLINGLMVYWDKVPNAAAYYVVLYVKEYDIVNDYNSRKKYIEKRCIEIDCEELPRNKNYFSFKDLAYLSIVESNNYGAAVVKVAKNYYVEVRAEDRGGNIIDKSEQVCGLIKHFVWNTHNTGYTLEKNWEEVK